MLFWNDGTEESNVIQNKFTKYLMVAVRRRKVAVLEKRKEQNDHEVQTDFQEKPVWRMPEEDFMKNLDLMDQIENEILFFALQRLNKREKTILIAHILNAEDYKELARAAGLGYKGVVAVYYRVLKKLRKELEDSNK